MFDWKIILPEVIDNKFRGQKVAYYFFISFTCLMTWRSFVHMFFFEYGLYEIANYIRLEGDPDPSPLIHMLFSIWGMSQLIFCIVCWACIAKIRSLIPALYILWLAEWTVRVFYYPLVFATLSEDVYRTAIPPGALYAPFLAVVLMIFLLLSIIKPKSIKKGE